MVKFASFYFPNLILMGIKTGRYQKINFITRNNCVFVHPNARYKVSLGEFLLLQPCYVTFCKTLRYHLVYYTHIQTFQLQLQNTLYYSQVSYCYFLQVLYIYDDTLYLQVRKTQFGGKTSG
jgi:hypothetical protein